MILDEHIQMIVKSETHLYKDILSTSCECDDDLDEIFQKQHLQKLQKQIERRNALLDGLVVAIWSGFDTRCGMITEKWNDRLDGVVLERYLRHY